jgi:hypothetical protein
MQKGRSPERPFFYAQNASRCPWLRPAIAAADPEAEFICPPPT